MADPGAAPHPAAATLCRSCHASGGCDIARNDRYSLDRGAADGGRGFFGAVLFVGAVRSDVACVRRMGRRDDRGAGRSEEHTCELQSLMRISYAVFCLKKKN